jgi:hypothetical protein
MFGGTYGDKVASHHFYQDLFPVAEFQAGKRVFILICVVGKDGYNEGEKKGFQHLLLEGGVQGDIVECLDDTCMSL